MASEYLDDSGGDVGSLVADIYGWSALSMLGDVGKSGKYYIPWLSKQTGVHAMPGVSEAALKSGIFKKVGVRRAMKGMTGIAGAKYSGISKFGFAQLGASRAIKYGFKWMAWNDPIMFAMTYWSNPLMLAVGAVRFAGPGMYKRLAGGLERNRYANLGRGYFPDSQGAFTSRQRAVRAISESQLQARSAIGNEAQLFHR